jgi:hypothetical protein
MGMTIVKVVEDVLMKLSSFLKYGHLSVGPGEEYRLGDLRLQVTGD